MGETETRIEKLFFEAREIEDPDQRAAFLREACHDDDVLRNEVAKLLSAHDRAGHFLNGGVRSSEAATREWEADIVEDAGPEGRIGTFHLIRLIGEGTFSRVYLAKQEGPVWRCVAVKIIKAGMDTREVVRRFRREREVLALMDHPGIAKIFDAGATPSGRPFFAMEWVQGVEITRFCDEQRLSVRERLQLFCDLCLAVMHAHQKGVIHRDLKPSNILVCENDGEPCPKVIDFGIVKVIREVAGGTAAATLGASPVGTPTYMSPEQAQVGNPDVDTRSDVYSLGALLYELLTGRAPFDVRSLVGASWERMATMIQARNPVRLSVRTRRLSDADLEAVAAARRTTPHMLCRTLQGDLDWIVLKTLEKEREARYQSVVELVDDIRHYLDHRPVSAAAPSVTYRLRKLMWRNRRAVAAAAVVAVSLLGSVIVSSRLAVLARSSEEQARTSQADAEQAEREALDHLIEVNVSAGMAANERVDHDQALLWFSQAALAAEEGSPTRTVNVHRAHNWRSWGAVPVAAIRAPAELRTLQFCPRSRHLMTLTVGLECGVRDVWEDRDVPWVRECGPVEAAAWSPDGALLGLAKKEGGMVLQRISDGEVVLHLTALESASAVAFSPDGHYLAYGRRRVILWDLEGGFQVAEWPHPADVTQILFSSQSDRLATACGDGKARVFARATEAGAFEAVGLPLAHRPTIRMDACEKRTVYHEDVLSNGHPSTLAFLDGGQVLATRSDAYEVAFWELASGRKTRSIDRVCCSCNFRISADGTAMGCGVHGNVAGVWDTRSGTPLGAMLPQGGCVFDVAFGPRSHMLLVGGADHTATFWSLDYGERVGARLHHFNDVMTVAYAADGRLVATAQVDGLVRIWKVPQPGIAGPRMDYVYGPKRVRLGHRGRLVVAAKDPAWRRDFHETRVYEVATGAPAGPVIRYPGCVQDAEVSPDGRLVAVVVNDTDRDPGGELYLHDVRTGKQIGQWSRLPSPPMSLSWHPAGSRVAFVCQDGEVGMAAAEPDGRVDWLQNGEGAAARVNHRLSFAPDGSRLISLASGEGVKVWRIGAGRSDLERSLVARNSIWSFSLSGSGRYLATTSASGGVEVWDLETGAGSGPVLTHPDWVYRAGFSSDEGMLVTACHDGYARVWNWREGTLLGQPMDHADQVLDAVFTPNDRWILTASHDGAIRAWDPLGGKIVMPPYRVGEQALNIEISPDGRHAVVGSLGKSIHVLNLSMLDEGGEADVLQLRALGEVLSNGEIRDGRWREFTAAEWLERFHHLRKSSPDDFRFEVVADRHTGPGDVMKLCSNCGGSLGCAGCPNAPAVPVAPTGLAP